MKSKDRMHVNKIKKEMRLTIGGQFTNSWTKMKPINNLTFHK